MSTATIDGRTLTLGDETRTGYARGPFLVHRGFGYKWQLWTITIPSGGCLGYYPTRAVAFTAADVVLRTYPAWDWHAPIDQLPEDMRIHLVKAVSRAVGEVLS